MSGKLPLAAGWIAAAWIAGVVAGCASPREHLYSLEPESGDVRAATSSRLVTDRSHANPAPTTLPVVAVGPLTLPDIVDRPQLVVRDSDYAVSVLEQERWAAPLKETLPRLLATQLSAQLPERRFLAASSPALGSANARLAVEITRFDLLRTGGARVSAHWNYRLADTSIDGDSEGDAAATGRGYEALVDAARRACAALTDDIAAQIRSR